MVIKSVVIEIQELQFSNIYRIYQFSQKRNPVFFFTFYEFKALNTRPNNNYFLKLIADFFVYYSFD